MSTITADPNMLAVLSRVIDVTEIRDASGNLVGIFTPGNQADEKPLFDLEEAERISGDERDKGRPLNEIWADIRAGSTL